MHFFHKCILFWKLKSLKHLLQYFWTLHLSARYSRFLNIFSYEYCILLKLHVANAFFLTFFILLTIGFFKTLRSPEHWTILKNADFETRHFLNATLSWTVDSSEQLVCVIVLTQWIVPNMAVGWTVRFWTNLAEVPAVSPKPADFSYCLAPLISSSDPTAIVLLNSYST